MMMNENVDDGEHGGSSNLTDRSKRQTLVSGLIVAFGLVLMIYMVAVESEPGAVPLLLILIGAGWYVITRVRKRSPRKWPLQDHAQPEIALRKSKPLDTQNSQADA